VVELGRAGGDVMECEYVWVGVMSLQPQNNPGVSHSVEVDPEDENFVVTGGSLQPPKYPLEWHEVEELVGEVMVGIGCDVLTLLVVVVISSLHPNQPGVLQVEVVVVLVLVVDPELVVVSSRQPHQPGVLQVEVRVFVLVEDVDVVVALLLLPVTSFHSGQS